VLAPITSGSADAAADHDPDALGVAGSI